MGKKGYTLVEVVIAMLLTSIMVSSVFSVALSAKQAGGKAERRLAAAQVTKQVTSMLKNYVTGDQNSVTPGLMGPNANNGTNRWSIVDATVTPQICVCSGIPGGCVPSCAASPYALTPGTWTVSGILPSWLAAAPYNGTLKYYVGNETVSGDPVPQINVTVDWTEP